MSGGPRFSAISENAALKENELMIAINVKVMPKAMIRVIIENV